MLALHLYEHTRYRIELPLILKKSPPPCSDVASQEENVVSSTRSFVSLVQRIPPPFVAEHESKKQLETYWFPCVAFCCVVYLLFCKEEEEETESE